jgi:hypothetical protein
LKNSDLHIKHFTFLTSGSHVRTELSRLRPSPLQPRAHMLASP